MPDRQYPHQSASARDRTQYSPRLSNEDLAPVRDQTWNSYNYFSFWMSDVHSMGGYVVAASLFTLGLASWQVLVCLLAGICLVQFFANLVTRPSWLASNALMLVVLKFWPELNILTSGGFLGLSPLGWISFLVMWCLQAMVFWRGMNAIKHFIDIAGPAVYIVMLALAG